MPRQGTCNKQLRCVALRLPTKREDVQNFWENEHVAVVSVSRCWETSLEVTTSQRKWGKQAQQILNRGVTSQSMPVVRSGGWRWKKAKRWKKGGRNAIEKSEKLGLGRNYEGKIRAERKRGNNGARRKWWGLRNMTLVLVSSLPFRTIWRGGEAEHGLNYSAKL